MVTQTWVLDKIFCLKINEVSLSFQGELMVFTTNDKIQAFK